MESCASFEDDALYAQSETTVTDGECSKRCTSPRLPALDPVECAVLRKFATESASCEMTRSMRTPWRAKKAASTEYTQPAQMMACRPASTALSHCPDCSHVTARFEYLQRSCEYQNERASTSSGRHKTNRPARNIACADCVLTFDLLHDTETVITNIDEKQKNRARTQGPRQAKRCQLRKSEALQNSENRAAS